MSVPFKLYPVTGVNLYKQLPKEMADTLKHSSNDSNYPAEVYHAIHKQRVRQSKNSSNITPLF